MEKNNILLKRLLAETLKEKDVLSLFKAGGTTALVEKIKGSGDFALISFLIVK